MNRWLGLGALNGFLAVGAGAFGAHALQGRVPPDYIGYFQTGAHYHLTHALAIIACAFAIQYIGNAARTAAWLFLAGIVLFSGSLYIYGALDWHPAVYVTPVGGMSLLAGWATLALGAWRAKAG